MTTAVVTVESGGQPATLAVIEYVPEAKVVTAPIVGFCKAEAKLLGPVHEYVAPASVLAVRLNVNPEHTGVLLPRVGADGGGLITTEAVPATLVQPRVVAVTE
jgi:hypothetical protein